MVGVAADGRLQDEAPGCITGCEIGRVDGHHVRRHARMDVAKQTADANAIERHVLHRVDWIDAKVELLSVHPREHVVEDAIVIRKPDLRADADCEHVRKKFEVALIEDRWCFRGQRRGAGRVQPGDHVHHGT